MDGQSPIQKDFDPSTYPLTVPYSLYGEASLLEAITALHGPQSNLPLQPTSNRDPADPNFLPGIQDFIKLPLKKWYTIPTSHP